MRNGDEITMHQECINCRSKYAIDEIVYFCRKCGDLLEVKYDNGELERAAKKSEWRSTPLSVWRYRDFMPISDSSKIVSLNEGGTGLHRCQRLGNWGSISFT
jgi:threonine synthase